MKKYECKACVNRSCTVNCLVGYLPPKYCTTTEGEEAAVWKEVKEDKEDKEIKEERLPDWCKVEEWLYLSDIDKYTKILACDDLSAIHSLWKRGRAFPARKRSFNADEMKALVGKRLETTNGDVSIATDFDISIVEVCIAGEWYNKNSLLNSIWLLDGKPCCKFEHLENGEWVE